jgi:hypothetical protein
VYENAKGAVNLRSSFDDVANPLINPISAANGVAVATPGLAAYISNDTSFNIMAKYVFELPGKDKLTVYAGYSHIEKAHGDYEVGAASQGNYPLDVGININNTAYYNLEWLGARYAMASGLNLSAGLYKADQNSWTIGLGTTGTDNIGCSGAGLLCDGDFYEVSVVADYVYNKHYDLYAGVNWSEVTDGLASGFNPNQFATASTNGLTGSQNQSTVTFGARVKF